MTTTTIRNRWSFLTVMAMALVAMPAYPQITLTGAIQFATNPRGAFSENQSWNTLGGDACWDLWLAQYADASWPINGPSDAQAAIDLSLTAGKTYQFYIFGAPDLSIAFNGLNLFFDGNNSTPGISVFGATNSTPFSPDSSSGTRTLAGGVVTGSGSASYGAGGVVAVLTGYSWNAPATPPGDVAQAFAFSPGGGASFFGSFTLQVFPAASLTGSLPSASPGTRITLTGSGFAPSEAVDVSFGGFGSRPFVTATTDAAGSFTITALEPQAAYGSQDVYAVGEVSAKLGATSIFVTPALVIRPRIGSPGTPATTQGLGFGAGEAVDLYWGNPRQWLGIATAGSDGSFVGSGALKITIPANAPPGSNVVAGVGQITRSIAIGKITVE